ncbi:MULTISPECIES: hypothetical protein [unclassified Sinorhizobium]|uniref:hypothetical protein n=1 Tax=unclassified Sinorhizobium TaxID=2613772 RepID=UPI003525B452
MMNDPRVKSIHLIRDLLSSAEQLGGFNMAANCAIDLRNEDEKKAFERWNRISTKAFDKAFQTLASDLGYRLSPISKETDRIGDEVAGNRLIDASKGLKRIVEEIDGTMNHGTWRDSNGMRLKDTPEWVDFYIALASLSPITPEAADTGDTGPESEIINALLANEPFVFDPATNFIHADDGGAPEHGIKYVPAELVVTGDTEKTDV